VNCAPRSPRAHNLGALRPRQRIVTEPSRSGWAGLSWRRGTLFLDEVRRSVAKDPGSPLEVRMKENSSAWG